MISIVRYSRYLWHSAMHFPFALFFIPFCICTLVSGTIFLYPKELTEYIFSCTCPGLNNLRLGGRGRRWMQRFLFHLHLGAPPRAWNSRPAVIFLSCFKWGVHCFCWEVSCQFYGCFSKSIMSFSLTALKTLSLLLSSLNMTCPCVCRGVCICACVCVHRHVHQCMCVRARVLCGSWKSAFTVALSGFQSCPFE